MGFTQVCEAHGVGHDPMGSEMLGNNTEEEEDPLLDHQPPKSHLY